MKNKLLESINSIRGNDIYPSDEIKNEIINSFFPNSTSELVQDLSGVTGAFYGILLKTVGEEFGNSKIDDISKKVFYELGKLKAQQAKEIYPNMPFDTRAFAMVLISAIYNASPEYSFNVIKYDAKHTIIELNGVDRYLRILNQLNISEYVTFPTLIPFFEGIKDSLNINCKFLYTMNIENNLNKTNCIYEFINNVFFAESGLNI